jgi:hypothetical protein
VNKWELRLKKLPELKNHRFTQQRKSLLLGYRRYYAHEKEIAYHHAYFWK